MDDPDPHSPLSPPAGETTQIAPIHQQQPNPPNPTTDPCSPIPDLQPCGSQRAEIPTGVAERSGACQPAICAEDQINTKAQSLPAKQSNQAEEEEQILADLVQDINLLLQASDAAALTVQDATDNRDEAQIQDSQGLPTNGGSPVARQGEAQRSSNQDAQSSLKNAAVAAKAPSPSISKPPKLRYTRAEKEKWTVEHSSRSSPPRPWRASAKDRSPSPLQHRDRERSRKSGPPSWLTQSTPQLNASREVWKEVKGPYWWRREQQTSTSSAGVNQKTGRVQGSEHFKQLAYGKCFNCLATDHQVRHCRSPTSCWCCRGRGHHANRCPAYSLKARAPEPRTVEAHRRPSPPATQSYPSNRVGSRSYLEVARGDPAPAAMAAYPGDPRARPACETVFVSATGAIKRRRDALLGRAAVCWLQGNSHDSESYHVGDVLRSKLGMDFRDFQVVKHYPEQYLVIFSDERLRQRATRQQRVDDGGRIFNFAAWSEAREAEGIHLEYRVNIRIEGIPPHAWGQEVAALILGRSCAVHYVEEHTRRRERTRTYDLWAWCADSCKIPRKVWLTIADPDAEQPSVDIPLPLVQVHHDEPTGLKHALVYKVFPHVAVVEDLTFLTDDGGQGGPPNRKRRRDFVWRYGEPDAQGEARGRRGDGRGRDEHRHHRRDDDDGGHGGHHRRHRSASAWGRVTRCRNGAADCYSSNIRGRGFIARNGGSYQSRIFRWEPKKLQHNAKIAPAPATKRTKGDKPPYTTNQLPGVALHQGKTGNNLVDAGSLDTMDIMTHFEKPMTKMEMEALQELVEHGTKLEKKAGCTKKPGAARKMAAA